MKPSDSSAIIALRSCIERDDAELGHVPMADLARHQRFGDDADHLAARGQRRVGDDLHQADVAAAEHDVDPARRRAREASCSAAAVYAGRDTGVRSRVDADALHGIALQAGRSSDSSLIALPRQILSTVSWSRSFMISSATFFVCGHVESVCG